LRRFAVELRSSIASILRAIDIEGALLIFAVGGAAVLGYTVEWRVAVLVLVIAAALAAVIFARAPRDR
jgi:hypothetical protein